MPCLPGALAPWRPGERLLPLARPRREMRSVSSFTDPSAGGCGLDASAPVPEVGLSDACVRVAGPREGKSGRGYFKVNGHLLFTLGSARSILAPSKNNAVARLDQWLRRAPIPAAMAPPYRPGGLAAAGPPRTPAPYRTLMSRS
jgi:hypothetical protein